MTRKTWAALAALAVALAPLYARSASPNAGTLSPRHTTVGWSGGPLLLPRGATVGGVGVPEQEGTNIDTFKLTIALPKNYWASRPLGAVRIRVAFPTDADLDINVSKGTWSRASTLRSGDFDQVTLLRPANGTYTITLRVFKPLSGTYSAVAQIGTLKQAARPRAARTSAIFGPSVIVDKESKNTGEPNVAVDSKGRVYVTAPGGGVNVWRSDNGGKSFNHLGDFDTDSADGGGGDSDIEIDQNDNLYIADLAVATINIQRSTDHGKTFGAQTYTGFEADRQWLATHGDNTVYLGYHDFVAETELVYRSDDQGATFKSVGVALSDPQAIAQCLPNTFSGPVAVDHADETVYITFACSNPQSNATSSTPPFGVANQLYVGVSHDRGATFTNHKVVEFPMGASVANLFPSMALDHAGNAYVAWAGRATATGPADAYVAVSKDQGVTWSKPFKVNSDPGTHFMAWVAAGDAGRIDVAWISTPSKNPDDINSVWNVDMAQSLNMLSAKPTFTQSRVSDHPIHIGQVCTVGIICSIGGDRTLLDFIEVGIDPKGMANVVWTENAGGERHIGYAKQKSGNGVHAPPKKGAGTSSGGLHPHH